MAFRISDRYCFNIIELTDDIDFKKMTPRSKVKRNILTFHSEDEEDVVIFQREDQLKGGNMQFAHILRKEKEEMVQVNAARFAIEKGIYFAVDKARFEEVRETALAFECMNMKNLKHLSSIGVGGTSTVFLMIAPLTLFDEAP